MWRQLKPAEQARLLGSIVVGGGVLALAIALLLIAWQVRYLQQQLPEVFAQRDGTLARSPQSLVLDSNIFLG